VIGRISGFRGRSGEITVRIASGNADRWVGLSTALIAGTGAANVTPEAYVVESARAYRDRLVLKLQGIDDPSQGDALRGRTVLAAAEDLPELPEGRYFAAALVGMTVRREGTTELLGEVTDVVETSGTDVLVVAEPDGHELLVPMASEIVVEVREDERAISVRLPEGLRELNREKGKT
jgi:16S rRNA processing protein RimM